VLDYRIETFLTLYQEMNYRRTAEKLNMTQPGVTQHIHYLENFYGVKLFLYNGRELKRTAQAEQLKRHFESVRAEELSLRSHFKEGDTVSLRLGATKTIGEFVIVPAIRGFLADEKHSLDLLVDNTRNLLTLLEQGQLDFAVIEGIFDKEKYPHHLYKKEKFVGICAKDHPFAGKTIPLEAIFRENLVVREAGSGTRMLLEQAVENKGFSFASFRRCSSISNFAVISELVAKDRAITFAYAPIVHCREDLASFMVEDMQISGEFNFVYASEEIARPKVELFLGST